MENTTFGNYMNMGTAVELVKMELLAQEAGKIRQVPALAGRPGIGKTESIKAMAKQIEYELVAVQISAVAPEEFSGIPDFIDAPVEFSREYSIHKIGGAKATRWSVPELVALVNTKAQKVKEAGGKGVVLLLDDIHAADPALERYFFNLLLDKVIGQYKLASNVLVAAAMNDSADAGFEGFNSAVLDRLAVYHVKFDFDHWYKIIGASLHPLVAAFLRSHQEFIVGEESVDKISPSPRSWTELSNFLNFIESTGQSFDKNLRFIAMARVGDAAASELIKFYTIYKKFDFEKMVRNKFAEAEAPVDPVEQILFSTVIRFVKSKEDGENLFKFIESNIDRPAFISALMSELMILVNGKYNGIAINNSDAIDALENLVVESDNEEITKYIYDAVGIES